MANRNRGVTAVAAGLLALSLGACEYINPITTDPNAVPTASVDQLFTGIQVNTFFWAEGELSRDASIFTQQMAGTDRQFASIDHYVFTEEEADGEFSSMYTGGGLIDLKQAIALAKDAGRSSYAGILEIYEAYLIGMGSSIWGAIPYSQAASDVSNPALDPMADVYASIQSLLDQAISDLQAGGPGPGATDMNFSGDVAKWTAVAHTLKARFYMHWAEVNGQSAYQNALAQAQQGIADPSTNWVAVHTAASTENDSWYQFMRDRSGYVSAGDYLVPLMVKWDDPRLPFYFSEASGGGYAARDSELSPTGYGAPAFNFPIATCAETAYIRAEAQYQLGNEAAARQAAKDGLACQEARWDVSLDGRRAALDAASGNDLFVEIMNEKYVADFLNIDVWNDYKRTCLPAITPREGGVPGRLYYGQQERQTNPNVPPTSQQPARNANDPNPCS